MIIAQTGFIFNSVKIKHIFTVISAHPDLGSDVHATKLEWLLSVLKVFTVIDQDSNGAGYGSTVCSGCHTAKARNFDNKYMLNAS